MDIKYKVTENNIHIEDSYKVWEEIEMIRVLSEIKLMYLIGFNIKYFFCLMSLDTLLNEWKAHNLLYEMHLFRSHTKDVDLNENNKFIRFCYYILAKIYDIRNLFR